MREEGYGETHRELRLVVAGTTISSAETEWEELVTK